MRRARTFRAANAQMRQLCFGILDLAASPSDTTPARDGEVIEYSRRILQEFVAAPLPDDHAMIAGLHASVREPGGVRRGLLLV